MTATIGWWAELFTEPTPASISVTGGTPTVSATENHFIQPASAALAITGGTPTMGDSLVSPGAASIALAGGTPTVTVGRLLQPAGASLTVTGGTPVAVRGNILTPSGASLSTTGGTPTVTVASSTPPAFDASGTGTQAQAANWTYSHTATAGAYAVLVLTFDRAATVTAITYGGSAMTLLGTVNHNSDSTKGFTAFYGRASVPGGAQTVSVTLSVGTGWACSNTFSYTGVSSVGTAQSVTGLGTSLSQSVTRSAGQRIVQAFGHGEASTGSGLTSPSGGTNRFNQNTSSGSASTTFSDATATATYTAASASSCNWAGIALALNP